MFRRKQPYIIKEEPGVKHYCACGKTKTSPYCDGSHGCTGIEP